LGLVGAGQACGPPEPAQLSDAGGKKQLQGRCVTAARGAARVHGSILIGAPRPMKMGTTRSPWHYDVVAGHTVQSPMQRPPSIFHYASSRKLLSDLASATKTPQAFDAMFLVRGDLASDRYCVTEFQMRD